MWGKNRRGETAACVLAVDDEPLNRDLLVRVLGNEFEVREQPDASGARAALDEHGVGVVLADQQMPNESGVELLASLRKSHPHVVGVLLTGAEEDPEVV